MFRVFAEVRTVWVKELEETKRQGQNGEFDAKSILFRVASDRNYTRTNGQGETERPTDFALCRANGGLAEVIAKHCSEKDPQTGKLISRHLNLYGHFEMYTAPRNFEVKDLPVTINGVGTVNLSFTTAQNVDGLIFVVDELEFLDKKPTPKVQAQGATISNVSVTPVATQQAVVAGQQMQMAGQVVGQPAVAGQQAVAMNATVANQPGVVVGQQMTQATNIESALNPPVIPEGFTGNGSPF